MTVTVNLEAPQIQPENGPTGVELSRVIMPYSIHNTEDPSQYLGGQTILTKEDGVTLADNTADWNKLALAKIKDMVAASEMDTPAVMQETDTTDVAPAVTGIVPEIDNVTLEEPNAEEGKVM